MSITASASGEYITIQYRPTNTASFSVSASGGATASLSLTPVSNGVALVGVRGVATEDDTVTLTVHQPSLSGGEQAVTYSVSPADTITTMASGLAVAVNENASLHELGILASNVAPATLAWSESLSARL